MTKFLFAASLCFVMACQNQAPSKNSEINQTHAEGLIAGQEDTTMPAVVQLTGSAICTGALVGLDPPTVITARHCIYFGATILADFQPETVIQGDFQNFKYDMETGEAPGDIAIAIYPKEAAQAFADFNVTNLFSVAPVSVQWQQQISICGFGSASYSSLNMFGYGTRRCGQALLETENSGFLFKTFIDALTKKIGSQQHNAFANMTEEQKVKYVHGSLQGSLVQYGKQTRYAIGRFTADAFAADPKTGFDSSGNFSLINHGDSGGPWFVKFDGDHPRLFGISSLAMGDPTGQDMQVLGDIAWRLDHPWSVALMAKAVAQGADITGFSELQSTIPQPAKPASKKPSVKK